MAVLAVLTLHAGIEWFRGGFIGVDVFFVLSGFLITLLLLAEYGRTHTIQLRQFYARRALRLLPAFIAMVLFCILVMIALNPSEGHGTFGAVPLSIFYLTDFSQAYNQGHLGLLGHTWSLSIEEHFYLVWPVVLILMLKRQKSARLIARVLVAAILLSSLYKMGLWLAFHDSGRAYYEPQSRVDALGIGCLTAVAMKAGWLNRWDRLLAFAAPICLTVLAAACFALNQYMGIMYVGGATGIAVVTAVVIVCVAQNEINPVARLLSWRPLVGVGLISYGLYIWHFPVYEVITPERLGASTHITTVVRVAAAFAVAILSYRMIERPFLRLKERRRVTLAIPGVVNAWRGVP